ncbi:MAG TPA: thermonuclease family protein, partial [Hydrogenophaga sp.]
LERRLRNQTVRVRERARDVYGRPLASLTLNGDSVAGWMVGQGWAWSYRWHGDPGPYSSEEAAARRARRGVFAASDAAMEPRQFRRSHGPCQRK